MRAFLAGEAESVKPPEQRCTMARPKPLAELIEPCLGPALAAQGFAASDVIVSWPDIVGDRLARFTQPIRIDWRRKRAPAPDEPAEPAVLVIRVEGAFALELQHLAPVVIERVNAHFGWRCIGRLALKQGPVRRSPPPAPSAPALSDEDGRQVAEAVGGIGEEALRAALDRLGRAVVAAERGAPSKP
jgi:hypothetical protein